MAEYHKCLHEKSFFISGGLIISLAPLQELIQQLYLFKNKDTVNEINTQVVGCFIEVFLQRNLAQKVEMSPDFTIFVRILQGVCHVREIDSLIKCQRIVREILSLLQCQGNLILFTDTQEWPKVYLNHHFSPLCHYLFCETYMFQRPNVLEIRQMLSKIHTRNC